MGATTATDFTRDFNWLPHATRPCWSLYQISQSLFLKTKLKSLVKSVAVVAKWLRRLTRNQLRSPCTGSNPVNCALFFIPFFSPCSTNLGKRWKKVATPGGNRTHNPWLRRPMPYPLGHGGRDG